MKLSQRLKIVIPVMLLAAVIAFAVWYFVNWYIPTNVIIPGEPIEMKRLCQNDGKIRIITKNNGLTKEGLFVLPEGKPCQFKSDYQDKVFIEQTVFVNGKPVKGIYRRNGLASGFTVTFYPGEQREYTLLLQIDWLVERHRFLDRYRGKAWRTNVSIR